jgi:hypothetical protein
MITIKLTPVRASALICLSFGIARGATLPGAAVNGPAATANIAEAAFCFERERGLSPERMPPPYLVLHLNVRISYKNNGTRPLIMPLEHERTVYHSLRQGSMSIFKELPGFLEPTLKPMKDFPPKVNPDNPVNPKNDYFTVIPAGGEMRPPIFEEIVMPVNHKSFFRHDPDLRGRRLYLRLQLVQDALDPGFEALLSDRWTKFGVPWTGTLLTNTFVIDVPQSPQGRECVDGPFDHPGNTPQDTGK